jgi:hypothetical protein
VTGQYRRAAYDNSGGGDEQKSTVRHFSFSGEARDKKLYRNARAEAYLTSAVRQRYPVASTAWFGSGVFCVCAQDISGSVNHRNDVDLVGFDVADDAVRPLDQFSNLIQVKFWHATTRERSLGNLLGPASQAVNHAQCVIR